MWLFQVNLIFSAKNNGQMRTSKRKKILRTHNKKFGISLFDGSKVFYGISGRVSTYQQIDKYFSLSVGFELYFMC